MASDVVNRTQSGGTLSFEPDLLFRENTCRIPIPAPKKINVTTTKKVWLNPNKPPAGNAKDKPEIPIRTLTRIPLDPPPRSPNPIR